MPKATESLVVLEALKILLRERKRTYRELAKHLGLSVPSVKRAMNSPDTPLSRIEEICGFLGLSLLDALSLARRESVEEFHFTREQEDFFATQPSYLAYFLEVVSLSPAAIEKKHGISRQSTLVYLRKLERMGLVELHPGDVVKTAVRGPIVWDDHGPIGRVFSRTMVQNMAARAAEKIAAPEELLLELANWKLTAAEFSEWKSEYRELARRYQALSAFNKRTKRPGATLSVATMLIADDWADPFRLEVKEARATKL